MGMKLIKFILAFFAYLIPCIGLADYPSAQKNHDLGVELKKDSQRLIQKFEMADFAIDGDTWLRSIGIGSQDFYHGVGYWIQARSEIRPNPFFTINARTILYSGSSSEGYANPTGFYSLLGFTGEWPERIFYSTLKIRIVDLERQNIGSGLLVQEREMNGALFQLSNEFYKLRLLADSTGALVSRDDMVNAELSLFNGWIGGGAAYWTQGRSQSNLTKNRDPYFYITSSQPFLQDTLSYALELGLRNQSHAGLISLSYSDQLCSLRLRTKVEYRRYESGFGKDFVGQIENQYVSYDQYNKSYTNAMNVFTRADDVSVYALHLDVHYDINSLWKIETLNEIGQFNYLNGQPEDSYYFYRAGVTYCPIANRDDCLTVFSSNKVLNESYSRPPKDVSVVNTPLFKRVDYIGIEGRFRF